MFRSEEERLETIEFDVQMKVGTLYDYKIQNAYKQPITILATCAGMLLWFLFISGQQTHILYTILGSIMILYVPFTSLQNAVVQTKMLPAFQKPLHYKISDEGIEVSQEEQTEMLPWDKVMKATGDRKSLFVYTSKNAAFVFPRNSMGDNTAEVIALIARNVPTEKMKIRY